MRLKRLKFQEENKNEMEGKVRKELSRWVAINSGTTFAFTFVCSKSSQL